MRKLVLAFSAFFILSCGKVKNSSSSDGGSTVGTAEFVEAQGVISSKCLSCHSNWSSYTADDFVANGLVFKGSPANSTLYSRIRGNDVGTTGDMPSGQPSISRTELMSIKTWISSL